VSVAAVRDYRLAGSSVCAFETAVRCGISILTVVLDNSSMAIEIPHLVVSSRRAAVGLGSSQEGGARAALALDCSLFAPGETSP
jgi:hypothetical protein